jgi:hypothetical protein
VRPVPGVRIWRVVVLSRGLDNRRLANAPIPRPTEGVVKRRRIRRLGIEGDVGDGPGPIKVHALHTGRIRQKPFDPG